jgi:hypothetical protein
METTATELEKLLKEFGEKFTDPQSAPGPTVARMVGLSASVLFRSSERLADWTRVLAIATILLAAATFMLAIPAFCTWIVGRFPQ